MKTIIILITIVIATATISCKKDTTTICENLFEQGSADSISLKGEWNFRYFAKSNNGRKITKKESIPGEKWIGFDGSNINGGICNALGGNYSINSSNIILISVSSITFKLCDTETNELESTIIRALNNAQCFVVRDNELIIHYSGDNNKNILLLLSKK